jgi:hypothetical protein
MQMIGNRDDQIIKYPSQVFAGQNRLGYSVMTSPCYRGPAGDAPSNSTLNEKQTNGGGADW